MGENVMESRDAENNTAFLSIKGNLIDTIIADNYIINGELRRARDPHMKIDMGILI